MQTHEGAHRIPGRKACHALPIQKRTSEARMQRRWRPGSSGRSGRAQARAPASRRSKLRSWPPYSFASTHPGQRVTWIVFGCLLVPSTIYTGEFPFEVTTFQAYNLKNFVSTPFSPKQQNSGASHAEVFRNELQRGLVRLSFHGRCVQ